MPNGATAFKPVRTAWLAAMIMRHRAVTYPQYATRFNRSVRTYYSDLLAVRSAGVEFESVRDGGRVEHTGDRL